MDSLFSKEVIEQLLNYPLMVMVLISMWLNNKNVSRLSDTIDKFIEKIEKGKR